MSDTEVEAPASETPAEPAKPKTDWAAEARGIFWLVLAVLPPLVAAVSGGVLACLVLGGVVYSLGSVVHTWVRVPFHNAAWHLMVVVAAALHLAAVVDLLS